MLNLVATATGYALDISEVTHISANWWLLITLVIGIFLVGWVIFDLYQQISKLQDDRPSIHVELAKEYDIHYLKVSNKGAKGTFKAQFELTSKEPSVWQLPYYNGHWRLSSKSEAEILKGQSDMIKVAKSIISSKGSSVLLRIFFHDEPTKSERYIETSSYWIGAYVEKENGSKKPMTKWDYQLRVSISSSPSLREGVYHGHYRLNVDRLEVDTNSLSTSHREGSQNE